MLKKKLQEASVDVEHRKLLMKKNNEISQLKDEVNQVKRHLQLMTSHELSETNREIEKLTKMVKNLEHHSHSPASHPTRISLEQLSDSFNDLKFQQALEEKKRSQVKIEELMNELADVATAKTKKHVTELQQQMAIVVEKQEVTDTALGKCAELCAFTLDHLHELTQFLSALLQQKEIRESLSEMTMFNIQSAIEKTLEFSQQASRLSTSMDGRLSSLPNISSLELLMNTARDSLANIKHFHSSHKSVQVSNDNQVETMQEEMEATKKELEEINRVNQMLEDEICQLKKTMQEYKQKIIDSDLYISVLNEDKDELNSELLKSKRQLDDLTSVYGETAKKFEVLSTKSNDLEKKLEKQTVEKFQIEMRLETSESLAEELRRKLETINEDLSKNWITHQQHDAIVRRLGEDIVSGEAQVEAIRMELESQRSDFNEKRMLETAVVSVTQPDDDKENKQEKRRTIEISDDRRELLMSTEETAGGNSSALVPSSSEPNCRMCQRYKAKNAELKKYLGSAMEKLKFHHELKARNDSHIQKQLSNTETFLQQARFNMENILKSRNSQDQ